MASHGSDEERHDSSRAPSSLASYDFISNDGSAANSSLDDSSYDLLSDAGRSDSSAQTENIGALSEAGDDAVSNGYWIDYNDLDDDEDMPVDHRHRVYHRADTPVNDETLTPGGITVNISENADTETEFEESDTESEVDELLNSDLKTFKTPILEEDVEEEDDIPVSPLARAKALFKEVWEHKQNEVWKFSVFLVGLLVMSIVTANAIGSGIGLYSTPTHEASATMIHQSQTGRQPVPTDVQLGIDLLPELKGSDYAELVNLVLPVLDHISKKSKAVMRNLSPAPAQEMASASTSSTASVATAPQAKPSPISTASTESKKTVPNKKNPDQPPLDKLAEKKKQPEKPKERLCKAKKSKRRGKSAENAKAKKTPAAKPKPVAERATLPLPPPRLTLPDASFAFARAHDVVSAAAAAAARAERVAESISDRAEQAWDQARELLWDAEQHQKMAKEGRDMLHGLEQRALDGAGEAARVGKWALGRFRARWEDLAASVGRKAQDLDIQETVERNVQVLHVRAHKVLDHAGEFVSKGVGRTRRKLDRAQKKVKKLQRNLLGGGGKGATNEKAAHGAGEGERNHNRVRYGFGFRDV